MVCSGSRSVRGIYIYVCLCGRGSVCMCVWLCLHACVCVCVGAASLQSCLHVASLLPLPPTSSPCCFSTSPFSLPYARYNLQPTQANVIFSLSFPPPQTFPTLLSTSFCSVPVPFVIDSLLSKLVSIDFHFVFVVAAKILIDSISYHGYFLQQWGNVIRKCFRY